jgi:hypothetical protein
MKAPAQLASTQYSSSCFSQALPPLLLLVLMLLLVLFAGVW